MHCEFHPHALSAALQLSQSWACAAHRLRRGAPRIRSRRWRLRWPMAFKESCILLPCLCDRHIYIYIFLCINFGFYGACQPWWEFLVYASLYASYDSWCHPTIFHECWAISTLTPILMRGVPKMKGNWRWEFFVSHSFLVWDFFWAGKTGAGLCHNASTARKKWESQPDHSWLQLDGFYLGLQQQPSQNCEFF